MCSHSVAAAEHNGDLDDFIQWLKKVQRAPNMTKLVTASMPKGRGRKGCAPPRKRMKRVPVTTHRSFAKVLEEQVSPTLNQIAVAESGSSDSDDSVNQCDLECIGGILGGEESGEDSLYAHGGSTRSSTAVPTVGKHCQSQRGGHVVLTHSTVTGGTQESSFLPPQLPPLLHCPSLSPQLETQAC